MPARPLPGPPAGIGKSPSVHAMPVRIPPAGIGKSSATGASATAIGPGRSAPAGTRPAPAWTRVFAALALPLAIALSACGSGLYDDSGRPAPGQWWPWVCADGGLAPDSGCTAPPTCADGGIDGGC